jgi:hypothetical protein
VRLGLRGRRSPPPGPRRGRATCAGRVGDGSIRVRSRGGRRNRDRRIGDGTERSSALATRRRPPLDWCSTGWTAARRGEGQHCQCQGPDEPPEQEPDQRLSRATSREPPSQRCEDTCGQHDHNEEVVGYELHVDSGGNESRHPTRGRWGDGFGWVLGGQRRRWCPHAPEVAPCTPLTAYLEQVRKCKCQDAGLKYLGVQDLGEGSRTLSWGTGSPLGSRTLRPALAPWMGDFFVLRRSCARCGHPGSQPCG